MAPLLHPGNGSGRRVAGSRVGGASEFVRPRGADSGWRNGDYSEMNSMKAYLITTGTVFGLITLAHIWRVCVENRHLATDPWFIFLTILAAGLCVWAWRLLRRSPRS